MTDTDSPTADPSTNGGGQRRGFGVDVGGSGVKGGIVDLDTGELIGDRFKLDTPQPATPEGRRQDRRRGRQALRLDRQARRHLPRRGDRRNRPHGGQRRQAMDRHRRQRRHLSSALDGQPVTVLNDADAAGLAEEKFGAGKDNTGVSCS